MSKEQKTEDKGNNRKWSLPKAEDIGELKMQKVERLNEDGTRTDITDKPDEWFPSIPDKFTDEERKIYEKYFYWTKGELECYNAAISHAIEIVKGYDIEPFQPFVANLISKLNQLK